MPPVNLGVILLDPLADGFRLLFNRDIAGVKLFHRLVITLNRAGLENIIVLCRGLPQNQKSIQEDKIKADPRFKGVLTWVDREEYLREEGGRKIEASLHGAPGFLLISGNVVTSPGLVKNFIEDALGSGALETQGIVSLQPRFQGHGGMHLVASGKADLLERYAREQVIEERVATLPVSGKYEFWLAVDDAHAARRAEAHLIRDYRHHYTQLMDIWVNSRFSLTISSVLVRTGVTPNQLTLFGLLIGLASGVMFARGDYLGGLLGGILAATTAVWDCCDGDVARLKFMESDFGETLDTYCDNIINVFVFVGIAFGMAHQAGWQVALIPLGLLMVGGILIFLLIYFPRGAGKGGGFQGTRMYKVIQVLASRNFIYVILLFGIIGRVNWFLWLAGFGSLIFAGALYMSKRKMKQTTKY